jgi:DNA transformation protein and related proteins
MNKHNLNSFTLFIIDQLSEIGTVKCRRMFSSQGLYLNGCFFGLINNTRLYLKTNEHTRKKYEQQSMTPFVPSKQQILRNYFEVPLEVIEDSKQLIEWVSESIHLNSS